MALVIGTRLGNYEIVAPLGSGGMGEVYRARDLRLGRSVAIKALPEAFARDPERLARFEREARLLASVHHANIAAIYGIEDQDGTTYLALELVEGETLAQRMARGLLGVPETLEICTAIAAAIDAAHEQGIVHRDLKPSNVMVTAAGAVKVLDFGLAKSAVAAAEPASGLSASPTIAVGETALGVVLGTASYMSPEQARGLAVDRRTDVWALGCILFECLSGRQAFAGETSTDVLARVLEREPDWAALPAAIPARLRDVLRRCLTKKVTDRPRDVGDLRGELAAIAADLSSPSRAAADGASIAVLYFQNLSTDPESDYFCDGVTEDILTDLSKVKGMRVASRSAVARYRGATVDTARVASELGVRAVLEGSVRRAGPRVRITVQLVSADGFQLWGERYDRTLEDVFAVQDEIASSIAGALKVALTPAESERLGQDRPRDVQAYDLYLKGREHYGRYDQTSLRQAIRLFEQAIQVDPSYAVAYAGIADAHGQLVQWSEDSPQEHFKLGLEAARRAIALNPRLPEGHKAEALVLSSMGDLPASEKALRKAIEVDPRFIPALNNLGIEWFQTGRLAGAERLFRRGMEIEDSPHIMIWLGSILCYTARYGAAEQLADRVRSLTSERFYVTLAHLLRATIRSLQNRTGELEQCLQDGRDDGAEPTNLAMLEAHIAARADRLDRARQLLDEFSASTSLNLHGLVFGAATALRVGDERAIGLMTRRLIGRSAQILVRLDPLLQPLLDHAPFAPRRSPLTLVWPVESPMIDRSRLPLFQEVRIESGTPEGSDVFGLP